MKSLIGSHAQISRDDSVIGASQVIIRQDQMPHTKFEGKPTLVGLVWALDDSPTVMNLD